MLTKWEAIPPKFTATLSETETPARALDRYTGRMTDDPEVRGHSDTGEVPWSTLRRRPATRAHGWWRRRSGPITMFKEHGTGARGTFSCNADDRRTCTAPDDGIYTDGKAGQDATDWSSTDHSSSAGCSPRGVRPIDQLGLPVFGLVAPATRGRPGEDSRRAHAQRSGRSCSRYAPVGLTADTLRPRSRGSAT